MYVWQTNMEPTFCISLPVSSGVSRARPAVVFGTNTVHWCLVPTQYCGVWYQHCTVVFGTNTVQWCLVSKHYCGVWYQHSTFVFGMNYQPSLGNLYTLHTAHWTTNQWQIIHIQLICTKVYDMCKNVQYVNQNHPSRLICTQETAQATNIHHQHLFWQDMQALRSSSYSWPLSLENLGPVQFIVDTFNFATGFHFQQ